MSTSLILYWVATVLILGIVILAFWKGGPPERMGSGFIIGIVILGRLAGIFIPGQPSVS